MSLSHDETVAALTANEPAVRPGQTWVIRDPDDDGRLVRAQRILGKWMEPVKNTGEVAWITYDPPDMPTNYTRGGRNITVLPEYNLRRVFALEAQPDEQLEHEEFLPLPYATTIETGPGEAAAMQIIKTSADIDRIVRDVHRCISTLEGIATFASGTAGDEAMATLKRIGVWSERVEREAG